MSNQNTQTCAPSTPVTESDVYQTFLDTVHTLLNSCSSFSSGEHERAASLLRTPLGEQLARKVSTFV